MKIRNSSRITAIVLALVMLLPLISIPTFAEVDPEKIIFSEDFSSYEGLEGETLKAKVKKSWYQTANNMEVITEAENTYLRFPIQALVTGTQYDVPYYAYNDSYQHFLKNNTAYSGVKSYDHETGTLVFAHTEDEALDLTVTVDTATANVEAGVYGTFSYGGTTYKLATGEYAACSRFGDGNCIDRYAHVYFGDRTLYTEEDAEVQAGTKKVGDVKAEPAGISYKEHDKVVVTYKAKIEADSIGKLNMQLNVFKGEYNGKTYSQNFVELGDLNLATGAWSGGALAGATLPINEWVELYFLVDMVNGTVQGIFDGKVYGSVVVSRDCDGDKAADHMTNLTLTGWSISKVMKAEPMKLQGAWLIDDLQVLTGDQASGLIKFQSYVNDFESANVGDTIPGMTGVNAAYKIASVLGANGDYTKVWALGNSAEGTGARDANARIAHEMFTAEMNNNFVLSADWYIPTGASGQFQTQLMSYNGYVGGVLQSKNWCDLYVIRSKDGVATLGTENSPALYTIPYDTWLTVTLEMDMKNATWDIYVNGSLALAGVKNASISEFVSFNASSIIFGKQNKVADSFLAGTMYLDNISMVAGAYEGAFSGEDVWTEDDLYAELLTFGPDNAEVAESGAFVQGHAYSFPSLLTFVDGDEDMTPDAIELAIASDIVDEVEMSIDKMVRPMHVGISAKKASTIVLSANYTVSEDAAGRIESELFDNAWISLFQINVDNSTILGVPFVKGEEFNITVVMDTVNGVAYVYYNNYLINKVESDKISNGLNGGEWSVAKVMKNCETYAGTVIVDDMTITCQLADEKSENALYLYDQADMYDIADLAPATVDAASVRLFAPTGLRFAAEVHADAMSSNVMEFGMIIAPADYVEAAGAFTTEALDTLGYVTNYVKVQAQAGNYYNGNGSTADLGAGTYVTASLVNILEGNISRDFAAIGYVTFNGVTYYADTYHVANVQDIAADALASGDYAGTPYESILTAYAAGEQPAY